MCRKKYVIQKLIVHMSVWYLFYSKMEDDVKQRVTPFALYYAMCSHVSFALWMTGLNDGSLSLSLALGLALAVLFAVGCVCR